MIFHKIADVADLTRPYKIIAKDKILFATIHAQTGQTTKVHIAFSGHDDLVIENLSKEEAHRLLGELGDISLPAVT